MCLIESSVDDALVFSVFKSEGSLEDAVSGQHGGWSSLRELRDSCSCFWLLFAFRLVGYSSLQWCICSTACHRLCFAFSYERSFFSSWKTRCSSSTYLSSRICLYPNSQMSFNLMRLAISGDVNPNPGPVTSTVSKTHLAEPTRKNYVSCLSLNARSIVNKRVDLCSRLSSTSFDLVAVTETWLILQLIQLKSFLARIMCIVKIAYVMVVAYY